ncbi:DeoR/GlpR family DNA-binding transcription regulator [Paludibacterium yongneupense]|uniref:DeoR/GlpR family DNA-binding transcription regulator n=1 Tax=Paludibacterium yongneupense TaxID=400061 RepID=UPI00040F0DA1|nr:DeoR/GlpR family DNA-binding transcription regulator [Paludibacterium yongneupense]
MSRVALPADRHVLIRERLLRDGRVLAAELAILFGVSEDSVRRDLRELAAAGVCQRVYGGAISMTTTPVNIAARSAVNVERKEMLARAAALLVRPGQLVFLDASSTNLAVARALPRDLGLTVATNAPAIAAALIEREDVRVLVIGGQLDHAVGGTLGAGALQELQRMRPDLCFLGICSIDVEAGIGSVGAEDAAFKRALVAGCGSIVAVVTTEKLGTAAPYFIAPLAEIAQMVVAVDADEEQLGRMRQAGVEVIVTEA